MSDWFDELAGAPRTWGALTEDGCGNKTHVPAAFSASLRPAAICNITKEK
jgi:hypothetical protein